MGRNNRNSLFAGSFVGGAIGVERIISGEDIETIFLASTIQGVQTYIIARSCIVIYGKGVEFTSKYVSEAVGKILIGSGIGVSSGLLNYHLQSDTGGSLSESVAMSLLSSAGILGHEYNVLEKLEKIYKNIKLELGK